VSIVKVKALLDSRFIFTLQDNAFHRKARRR